MIRILHFSDFHYKFSHDEDFVNEGKRIADSLKGQAIDLAIFSGDLVYETKESERISKAASCLFDPILETTGLTKAQLLIAPGNHDMKRGAEKPMVEESLMNYSSSEKLDSFCSYEGQLIDSLENFKSFSAFINEYYGEQMQIEPLYSWNKCTVKGIQVGLIAFNSAWRCKESRADRGKLLFPVSIVKEAFSKVRGCDVIICTQHHNISDFADFVAQDIEDEINEHCHILFTGHYHKCSVQTNHDSEIGLLHLSAPATYNRNDKTSQYGYSILEFNEDTFEGKLLVYNKYEDRFVEVDKKSVAVPVSDAKRELNEFRKLIRKRFDETLEKADALFVSGKDRSFLSLFKAPIIKNKGVQEILATKKEGQQFSLSEIISKGRSAIIFGYNKRGKTSLLRWIQLETLKCCTTQRLIPYYLDSKLYRNGKELDLVGSLHSYLEDNRKSVINRFNSYELLLLIDDLNPNDVRFMDNLKREMAIFPQVRFIATSLESMTRGCALMNFEGSDVDKYYLHDITNKEVHQLTLSWPNISIDNKRIVEEKIMQIFSQMHISLNYWTASLFLWIFEKTDPRNIHNNFELVKLYVDELLGMEDFINNDDFSTEYGDLKSFLGALAEKMLHSEGYSLDEQELFEFTNSYRESNKKFSDNPIDIINYLLKNGTIHRIDGKYTIRLKGVFEFLLAYRMTEDEILLNNILDDKYAFMSFGNELEFYAGFKKKDFNTISRIFERAKEILAPITNAEDYYKIDARLSHTLSISTKDVQCTGKLIERLSDIPEDEQADLLPTSISSIDETEVRLKTNYSDATLNAANVEHILFILSRIYRNSNACDDESLADAMLDYVLTGTCNLGFLLVEEAKKYELRGDENAEELAKLVSNFMPIIIQAFFYDAICQKNLTRVFKAKLESLIKSPKNNQLKIFIITFILVDLDTKENLHLVDEAMNIIDNKSLRYAILNKNILLSMKNAESSSIKNKLVEQRRSLIKEFDGFKSLDVEMSTKIQKDKNKESQRKHLIDKDYE